MKSVVRFAFAASTLCLAAVAQAASDPVLDAMGAELARSQAAYFKAAMPAYFIAYRINDDEQIGVNAEFGTLTNSSSMHVRSLNVELRTGSYAFDNTHAGASDNQPGNLPGYARGNATARIGLDDDVRAMRAEIWSATDGAYWRTVEELSKARADAAVQTAAEDKSDDFSREGKLELIEPKLDYAIDLDRWREKVKAYSAPFKRDAKIYNARAGLTVARTTRWLANSEGTRVRHAELTYLLDVAAATKAADGMDLPGMVRFVASRPDALPDDATVLAAVEKLMADLKALRDAPVIPAYEGPAILDNRAAGVFFHEVVGHRLEAHRLRDENDAQTFKKKLGERILPESISIAFDPTRAEFAGQALMGGYAADDEGVRARPVAVVQHGVLKNFLLGRTPVDGFAHSNGHGRSQSGFRPVSRQSNMIVDVENPIDYDALKKKLLAEIAEQGKPWGLIIRDLDGGFTETARAGTGGAKLLPTMVYRLYPDGREELVRGVDLVGTPLTLLAELEAGDGRFGVFHGWCGAESGFVPVSTVAPDLLIRRVEVQRKPKSQDRPPILPAPDAEGR
ncbi:MAG: metallopeptidase TldD-related protein [Rudaea sp.]|uniref:metallopeptidase TldD-related protein n=1 Tax=Rudaea sp. TaxID=2136325 RepID=UPI0039E337FE